ncbi:MAG: protein translocase subunit SecD, partial [Spirulinaceae cyanobacterium]
MQKQSSLIALIIVLVIGAIVLLVQLPLNLGLDLRGGAQLTIQVKPTEDIKEISEEDLEAVKRVMQNRVNAS